MTDGSAPGEEAVQLSLLHGFSSPTKPRGATVPADENPVAEVLIESAVPHLDRVFDYLVPQEAAAEVAGAPVSAPVGVRVSGWPWSLVGGSGGFGVVGSSRVAGDSS